ncbi:MAG: polyphosphate kinase 2 [Rhodanobacteraceae bacterium]
MKSPKHQKYNHALMDLHDQLVDLQRWIIANGHRVVLVFEGRDAAGKGGVIKAISEPLNTRYTRIVALPKPNDREHTQWYFQRYIEHLPAAGELVLFDRSWYNRAGVEQVMGFCTAAEYGQFLVNCPIFEKLLTDDGIILLKYWLAVDQKQQEERFGERATDPLKRWKISPIDLKAREQYAAYGKARETMLKATNTEAAPWFVADFNDQKRGRLNLIRHLLDRLPERTPPDKPLRLPKLKGSLRREKLGNPELWIPEPY